MGVDFLAENRIVITTDDVWTNDAPKREVAVISF
jgi:hypothetical protein